jgi:hypothetical protein
MPRFLVQHRHEPHQCGITFAAFKGHDSPLRHRAALTSCPTGGHAIWWPVEAASKEDALQQLPFYVAQRSTVTQVTDVVIP